MIETYVVPDFVAFTLGMVVYFVGARLTRRVAFLRDYNIPEPVSGGLAVALVIWAVYAIGKIEIEFELDTRDTLLVIFFTTIGLNARFADLVRGGKPLGILLVLTVGFMILQNVVALAGVHVLVEKAVAPQAVLLHEAEVGQQVEVAVEGGARDLEALAPD